MKKTTWFSLFPPALVLAALAAAAGFFGKNFYHNDLTLLAIKLRVNDLVLLALVIPIVAQMINISSKFPLQWCFKFCYDNYCLHTRGKSVTDLF